MRVDAAGSRFGMLTLSGVGFWMVLESNRTVSPVQTRIAGRLPGHVANNTHGISVLAPWDECQQYEVRLKIMSEWTQRYTPSPWLSEFGDAIVDLHSVDSDMHLEADIEWTQRCPDRQRARGLRDALTGRERADSEMHSEAMIGRFWRWTFRPRSREFGDALLGRDRPSMQMNFEAAIVQVWWYALGVHNLAN